ncbi:MAG: hypothetical protein CMJ81_01665 [Planctomycetaceae bacterium]|nr:hypothetical protein [Planctomycetaceae bacterium]
MVWPVQAASIKPYRCQSTVPDNKLETSPLTLRELSSESGIAQKKGRAHEVGRDPAQHGG